VSYGILLSVRARRELRDLPNKVIARLDTKLLALASEPRPAGCKKLKTSTNDGWRIRVGNYRILYPIDDNAKRILVYRIGHRRQVYE
jgi:mRNA interferase RelE/StbE